MNSFIYIVSSLKSRFLGSLLTVILTAFGIAMALIILLFTNHVQTRMANDSQNIDIVIGAKGSPLQIILSSIYHMDIPTGNISWAQARKWMSHPQIEQATPLALGDNWKNHPIVGTTPEFLKIYDADIEDGRLWNKPFEAVIGSDIALEIGNQFSGAHGLVGDGHIHDDQNYTVIGKLEKTGAVLDRLILTSMDSVLNLHGQRNVEHNDDDYDHYHDHEHENERHDHELSSPEITALLLKTKTSLANRNLPYIINQDGQLQAANPALEMARLTSMLGVGTKTLSSISTLLIFISCFSIFAGIAGTLENRKSDLAVLRALGYSKMQLFCIIAGEGVILVIMGCLLGVIFSYIGFQIVKDSMPPLSSSGATYSFISEMLYVYGGAIIAGFLASLFPAYRAAKIDVAKQLN